MKTRKPTQKDIAEKAGVSQGLVSMVFTNAPVEIAEETRARILEVAKELQYRSRTAVRVKRNKLLAYIRPVVVRGHHQENWIYDAYEEFYNRTQNYLMNHSMANGYNLMVRPSTQDSELEHWLEEWGVEGVFWQERIYQPLEWITEKYPVVQVNRHALVQADAAYTSSEEMIVLAMEHLQRKGHSRIHFYPMEPVNDKLWLSRAKAYKDYIHEHGMPLCGKQSPRIEEYAEQLCGFIRAGNKEAPTALITSDHTALRLMKELRERGLELPRELSLVGIDNISGCSHSVPALTSLDLCMNEVSRIAVELLINRIRNPHAPHRKVSITPRLVERESVADLTE